MLLQGDDGIGLQFSLWFHHQLGKGPLVRRIMAATRHPHAQRGTGKACPSPIFTRPTTWSAPGRIIRASPSVRPEVSWPNASAMLGSCVTITVLVPARGVSATFAFSQAVWLL